MHNPERHKKPAPVVAGPRMETSILNEDGSSYFSDSLAMPAAYDTAFLTSILLRSLYTKDSPVHGQKDLN